MHVSFREASKSTFASTCARPLTGERYTVYLVHTSRSIGSSFRLTDACLQLQECRRSRERPSSDHDGSAAVRAALCEAANLGSQQRELHAIPPH